MPPAAVWRFHALGEEEDNISKLGKFPEMITTYPEMMGELKDLTLLLFRHPVRTMEQDFCLMNSLMITTKWRNHVNQLMQIKTILDSDWAINLDLSLPSMENQEKQTIQVIYTYIYIISIYHYSWLSHGFIYFKQNMNFMLSADDFQSKNVPDVQRIYTNPSREINCLMRFNKNIISLLSYKYHLCLLLFLMIFLYYFLFTFK